MKYIDSYSKKGFVNLFADYILKHFNSDTFVEVSDCGSFLVVRGETNSEKFIDLFPIKENFIKDFPEFEINNINIIDIIKYNVNLEYTPKWFRYFDTERPIYSIDEIENFEFLKNKNKFEYPTQTITSKFPHGYGLNKGRFDFYFGEYVSNHIFNITNSDRIELKYYKDYLLEDLMLQFYLEKSIINDSHIFSLLLDVFYTKENLSELRTIIDKYDIINDIMNPLSEKPWLIKNKIEDIIVY